MQIAINKRDVYNYPASYMKYVPSNVYNGQKLTRIISVLPSDKMVWSKLAPGVLTLHYQVLFMRAV